MWLISIAVTTNAEDITQLKTSLGVLSISKKDLKSEVDDTWVIKLDDKPIVDYKNLGEFTPSFITELGNGVESFDPPKGVSNKVVVVDIEGELMAGISRAKGGNACDGGYVSVFYFNKNGQSNLLEVPGGECAVVNRISMQDNKLVLQVAGLKTPLVYESGALKTLEIPAEPAKPDYKNSHASKKAFDCVTQTRADCPYFTNVYNGDLDFRNSLLDALKKSGFAIFEWDLEVPMTPIIIGGESFIYGQAWTKFTDERVEVLYSLKSKISVGLYYQEYDKGRFFGNPSTKEQQVLKDISEHSGKNPIGKAASEGPFPVVVI